MDVQTHRHKSVRFKFSWMKNEAAHLHTLSNISVRFQVYGTNGEKVMGDTITEQIQTENSIFSLYQGP